MGEAEAIEVPSFGSSLDADSGGLEKAVRERWRG